MTHALLYDSHELKLFARTTLGHVIFTDGHVFGLLTVGIRHEHRERELHTHFVVALAQFLELLLCDVQFLPGLEVDRVNDAVGMDVLTVCVRAHQDFMTGEVLNQFLCRCVCDCRIDISALWKALHHVIEHSAFGFMVQILGSHEVTVGCFRLTVDSCDQLPTIMFRLPVLGSVSHHRTHAATSLTTFVICETYDCHGHHRFRSAISRTVVRMSARSCRTSLRLTTVIFPMCASVTS